MAKDAERLQPTSAIGLEMSQVRDWLGGLYVELQLSRITASRYRQEARDYQKALTKARLEFEELRGEVADAQESKESALPKLPHGDDTRQEDPQQGDGVD